MKALFLGIVTALGLFLFSGETRAQGTAFSYQGRISNNGVPANGVYDLQFSVYDIATAGNLLAGPLLISTLPVTNGLFSTTLDFGTSVFGSGDRWLEVGVRTNGAASFNILGTRQQILAVPYAITAGQLTGTLPATQVSGSLLASQIPNLDASQITTGTFTGDGGGLQNLNAANLINTISDAQLSGNVALLNGINIFTAFTLFTGRTAAVNPDNLFGGTFFGDGAGLTDLPAFNIRGVLSPSQIPNLDASKITTGTFTGNGSGLTRLNSANLTATISDARLSSNVPLLQTFDTFTPPQNTSVGGTPVFVTAADVNGDGHLDLISATLGGLSVLTNNGAGLFIPAQPVSVSGSPSSLAAVDVNGDGFTDLIAPNGSGQSLSVLTNDGSGIFVLAQAPGVGNNPVFVAAADLDGFGGPDLISADSDDNTLTILINAGSGGFIYSQTVPVGINPTFVTTGDVNGDGYVDIINLNTSDNTLTVLTNDGDGYFIESQTVAVGNSPVSLATGDVNGDGYLDLISANAVANTLTVLTNDGAGFFVFSQTVPVNSPQSVVVADFGHNSGLSLICASASDNALIVLTNGPHHLFAVARSFGVGDHPQSVATADLNGDGRIDLVSANSHDGTLSVLVGVGVQNVPLLKADQTFAGANTFNNTGNIFVGNGSGLTGLDALQIASGTVPLARLPGSLVTNQQSGVILGGAFTGDGSGLTGLNAANLTNTILDARLSTNVAFLNGTNVFTGTNRFAGVAILTNLNNQFAGMFNGSGFTLTNLDATKLTNTISDARLSTNVAFLHGTNVFGGTNNFAGVAIVTNANNQFGGVFTGNGSGLTGLNAANLTNTILDARLSTNVALLNGTNLFAGVAIVTNLNNQFAGAFTGNGFTLTNLDATQLTNTISDARLSTNVAFLNGTNLFGGTNQFTGLAIVTNAHNQFAGTFTGDGSGLTSLPANSVVGPTNRVIVAWGDNTSGQTNVPAGLTNVTAVAAGEYHSLALLSDGTVVTWGNSSSVPVGLNNVTSVAAGESYSLALKSDGTVVAWGDNTDNRATVPTGLNGVTAVAAGRFHSLALKSDGIVVAWGDNSVNQRNVPAGLNNVTAVAAGGFHSLALKSDGTVVAWGFNGFNQTTVPAGLNNVIAVAAGDFHSLALKSDGTVVGWGSNGYSESAAPAGLINVTAVAAGQFYSVALQSDGTVIVWGRNSNGQTNVPAGLSHVVALAQGSMANHVLAIRQQVFSPVLQVNGAIISQSFTGDGSGLTSLDASKITSGTFTGDGSGLTSLDSTKLINTISDARLSSNVPLLNGTNVFTGTNNFAGAAIVTNVNNQVGGTFTGDGAGLSNTVTAKNYVYAYDTTTQSVLSLNTFQNINFSSNGALDGWTHTAGAASFTSAQTGLFLVQCTAEVTSPITGSGATLIGALNGIEIAGSQWEITIPSGGRPIPTSKSFIASVTANDVLTIRLAGTSTAAQLIANTGLGATKPSVSLTIIRIQ